jgi:16S rRNA processing protein RimM
VGENLIVIGRLSRPHGVKGEVRIEFFNREDPHFFFHYQKIFIQEDKEVPRLYRPLTIRPHKHGILVQLEGIQNKDEAERLKGKLVLVDPAELPPLGEDEYYWHEILGMRVVTEQGGAVGKVTDIVHTGSNDVYVVSKGRNEFLIPAIKDIIIAIEKDTRTMVIRSLKGLLEKDDL